ncbi:MAG TPA: sigma-54 dependent transcriptional regulator [Terriglobia bacterium]|nr:sigma-54 dependent transcriptional regulator [Terriglobia bacterium]
MTTVVASDNPQFRHQVVTRLRSSSWTAEEVRGGAEALAMVEEGRCEILVLDRRLPDLDATELSWMVKARHPQVEVLVVDSEARKPLLVHEPPRNAKSGELLNLLWEVPEQTLAELESQPLIEPAAALPSCPRIEPLPGMIGGSAAMRQVYSLSRLVTTRNTTVLIIGETGTGKELVARAIHQLSPRAKQPLVTVNCAAIPESLLESELFGYARGAFTGASQSRLGRIHSAHGGTLFLDEIGELPLSIQAKLLRFLQEGEVQRLGSPDIVRVDVRVIAATNADLIHLIAENRFREDLYYRLTVFPIVVSPLRERPEDIPALSQHFLQLFCQESGVPPKRLTPAALRMLEKHGWPGNIRELRHTIERAFILSGDQAEILPEHISLQARLKKD